MAVLSQLGPYLLDEELAEGGMARVFRARLRGLGGFEKTLVVKQIKPELARDPRFVELFVREANTLVSLSHPHIVSVYELGAAEGTYYLSMEYVDGATVARILDDGPLAPVLVAHLGAQVCDALDYAHGRFGILHRDITPRNILVDRAGHARLLDFGIAGALGVVDSEVFGSPGYMAPEQARRQTLSPASDLFSLGAVLFEAATGRPAFEKSARGSLVPAPGLPAELPPPLARAITSMLAQEPRERPQEAAEVAGQLRGYLAQARPEGVLAEMRERAQRAESSPPAAVSEAPATNQVTARIEAHAIATSAVLTEILRSAPGVAMATAPVASSQPKTRPILPEELEPKDATNPRPTVLMLRAWPWLAFGVLGVFGWVAMQRPPVREPAPVSAKPAPTAPPLQPAPAPPVTAPAQLPEPAVQPSEPEKPAVQAAASLSVNATPWAEVTLDGRSLGTTPLRDVKVRAGAHVLRLRCPPLGRESELRVQIAPDTRARVAVDLSVNPPRTFLDGLEKVR